MAVIGELLVLVGANTSALTAGLAKSEAELKGFGSSGTNALAGIRLGALAVGAATVAGMGLAVNAASSFQEQMAIINTIAHETPTELDKTGESIRAMAVATGTPLSDMTKAFYDLLSAGIDSSKAISVLHQATTLSIGSLSTVDQAVDLLTTAINAYGLTAKGAATATDQFALAVQDGKVTADQIAATFADVAPLAKTAGIGIDEIGATYAVLTARGVPAAEAMTQMNRVMVELLKPNKDLADLQEKLHVSFAKVAADKGLVVALQEMRTAAAANNVPFQDLFGRLEGMKFALSTTGPFFANYEAELVKMHSATGTAAGQAEERMGTFSRQVAILGTSLTDLGISVGTSLLPPLTSFVQSVNDAVQSASAWAEANPQIASTILPIVAGIAALVIAATSLSAILGILGTAFGIITSPITILVVGIAALAAHFGLLGDGARNAVDSIIGRVTALAPVRTALALIGQAADSMRTALGFVSQAIGVVVGWVTTFVTHLLGAGNGARNASLAITSVGSVLSTVASIVVTVVTNLARFIASTIDIANKLGVFKLAGDLVNGMLGLFGDALRIVFGLIGNVAGAVSGVMSVAFTAFRTVAEGVAGAFNTLATAIQNVINLAGQAVNAVASVPGVKLGADVVGGAGNAIGNIANTIGGLIPHFQSGGVVPGSGPQLIMAHGGELVTPANQVGGRAGGVTAGGGPVQHVTHTHIHLDGREILDFVEEHLLSNANAFSSGLTALPGLTGA